uniref:LTI65/LTI78 PGEED repeat domain-containing protein n=1 Tax=Quercus lobata TaxID=97700 RepID=A0A7N2MUG2_QUELO
MENTSKGRILRTLKTLTSLTTLTEEFDDFDDYDDDRDDYMQEDGIFENNQLDDNRCREQELLLLISNTGGAPFLWKARWKYPRMAVEARCLLLAALGNSFDVTTTGNFFFISEYFSNVKDASRLFEAGVTFYLFKNRSSGARVLLPTSKAGGTITFHGKLNEELKLELVSNFQSNCFIEIYFGHPSYPNYYSCTSAQSGSRFTLFQISSQVTAIKFIYMLMCTNACSKWLPTSSSTTFGKDLDPEGICSSLQEMSSHQIEEGQEFETYSQQKKRNQDVSTTPSWVVRLDDDEDEEDPEFYGAPAFESRLAPEGYKETTRHNPRAIHKNFRKHLSLLRYQKFRVLSTNLLSLLLLKEESKIIRVSKYGYKVVSMKEYLMHKLEPREDVLSPVISKAMSPKRAPGDMGVD